MIFHDLSPELFPLRIEGLHWKTRAVVWSVIVERPASGERTPVYIPGRDRIGHPVAVRITFGDGTVEMQEPELPS